VGAPTSAPPLLSTVVSHQKYESSYRFLIILYINHIESCNKQIIQSRILLLWIIENKRVDTSPEREGGYDWSEDEMLSFIFK